MKNDVNDIYLQACGELLIQKKLTIAFAESATAGRICAEFALLNDAGKFLKGGLVCYDADLKHTLLGVPEEQLETHTPESQVVTCYITAGLQKLIPADIHIGCTGLTAPGGSETPQKPVGTMFLCGLKGQELFFAKKMIFIGTPEVIISQTIASLAKALFEHLKNDQPLSK